VEFFSWDGQKLGDKKLLERTIHDVTKIPVRALRGSWQSEILPHARITWSYNRVTTRQEDKVYSILGLLGIHMALIYGEGEEKAFIRLCKELKDQDHMYRGALNTVSYASDGLKHQLFIGTLTNLLTTEQKISPY
jgi:hypothetical protein